MKKLIIKNIAQVVLQTVNFENDQAIQDFINVLNQGDSGWGKPEHTIQVEVSPYIPAQYEEQSVLVKEAVLDEEGNELEAAEYELQMVEISPAVEAMFEDQVVPSEFEVEIVDITAQVEQAEINRQAKAFLAASDFMVLRHIRQKALGEVLSLSEEDYLALEQQRSDAAASVIE